MRDVVLVKDKDGKHEEIVNGLDYASFQLDKEFNSSWQITFTAYKFDDSALAFDMLVNKSLVKWHGQWFSVEQPTYDVTDGVPTKQIVAIHVMFSVQRIRPNITPFSLEDTTDDNGNTITATPQTWSASKLMHLAFDGNAYGYSINVIGETTSQLTTMDRQSALDMINTYIVDDMGWVFTADNYQLTFQSLDTFKKSTGKIIHYQHDSNAANIAWDSTSLANAVRLYGKDNVALGEWVDQDSIDVYGKWYGDDVTSDTATSASSLNSAASKSVNSTSVPTSTFTISYRGDVDDYDWGDMVVVDIPELDLNPEMMVSAISATPYTHDPETITVTTGNSNKANVNSLLQIQRQFNTKLNEVSQQTSKLQSSGSSGTINTGLNVAWTEKEVAEFDSKFADS